MVNNGTEKNNLGKAVELRSEEVQDVMNRIPSAIVRWGMTMMAVIVTGLLIVAAYLPWPETMECTFEGNSYGTGAVIYVTLAPETAGIISRANNLYVTLYSPMFSDEFADNSISGIITDVSIRHQAGNEYTTLLNIEFLNTENRCDTTYALSGNILLILSDNTLFQRMTKHIRDRMR